MVGSARTVILQLQETVKRLQAESVELVQSDALMFLQGQPAAYDVVFLDPPYDSGLLDPVLQRLIPDWVVPGGLLYLEHAARGATPPLPEGWEYLRSKRTSQVGYHLVRGVV